MPRRDELLKRTLDETRALARVDVDRVELAPGEAAGLHLHPCDVVGVVVAGEIRVQISGGAEAVLRRGDAFHEPAGVEVTHFDNASEIDGAAFVACYLRPPGVEELIRMLDDPTDG